MNTFMAKYTFYALFLSYALSNSAVYSADTLSYHPEKLIIIFDVDDVLLTLPRAVVTNELWNHKGALVRGVGQFSTIFKLLKQHASAQEWEDALGQTGNKKLAECV